MQEQNSSIFGRIKSFFWYQSPKNDLKPSDMLPSKIAIFIGISNILPLANELTILNKEITEIDRRQYPIKNTFHFSLRHIVGYPYNPDDFQKLEDAVKNVAQQFTQFEFTKVEKMKIDSDSDVGIDYEIVDRAVKYDPLLDAIKKIISPGESKYYEPHTTVYYQVQACNMQKIRDFINKHPLDTKTKYTALSVGVGILGEYNNLIDVRATYDLLPNTLRPQP
jgi:hypothetical protein